MKYATPIPKAVVARPHVKKALCGLAVIYLTLTVISGCRATAPAAPANRFLFGESATIVHRPDGRALMEISDNLANEISVGTVRQVPLPNVLEATGQVTFDDKLVSTIISRLTGRIEEMLSSQWQMVRRGERVMKVYSPDYMSAEAEYLAASSGQGQVDGRGPAANTFGIPASFDVAANLRQAAIRKLELLGFTTAEIASIRTPNPTVWVSAPISGIIVSKNVVRGQAINPGDQLLALATLQRVWITADIYQEDLSRVYVGQSLAAETASYPGQTFQGRVDKISPALDPNIHTLQLRCVVQNLNSELKPQMLARVRLATSPRQALVVPQAALVFDDSAYFAFVRIDHNTFERRKVQIVDWSEPRYFRVARGLGPGDQFLTSDTLKFEALWHNARTAPPGTPSS
jgi:membrane fusion protein, copper/silver efflux system